MRSTSALVSVASFSPGFGSQQEAPSVFGQRAQTWSDNDTSEMETPRPISLDRGVRGLSASGWLPVAAEDVVEAAHHLEVADRVAGLALVLAGEVRPARALIRRERGVLG